MYRGIQEYTESNLGPASEMARELEGVVRGAGVTASTCHVSHGMTLEEAFRRVRSGTET